MVTETDYQDARENLKLRADFVKAVDLEEMAEFVSEVSYNPDQRINSRANASVEIPWSYWLFPREGHKPPIRVYPLLFEFPRLDDFLSTLVDHEGFHAKDIFCN